MEITMPQNPQYIPFILGEETRPKIESFITNDKYSIDITQSIFYKQYCLALSCVAELVSYNEEFKNANQHKTRNNIIIFTGDRGSGKTSCMMSVKELLCNTEHKKELYHKLSNLSDSARNLLTNTAFHELETIGPMYFDSNHNILELFIGNLYIKFKEKECERQQSYHAYPQNSTHSNKEKLLNRFSEAKRNLSLLYKKDCISEYDNLEELKDLAASMNLRTSLCELVQEYIKYMYGEKHQLILDIDDIDLNMTNAYETIEQIRKYLKIPGLIILMSVKLGQFANVVRIKHAKEYETLIDINQDKYYEVVNKLTERHLTKTFPLSQRVKLPKVKDLLDKSFKIIHPCTFPDGEKEKYLGTLNKELLALIYQKTGLLFYNAAKHPSYIIPSNLRELLNFIHHLYDLNDAKNHIEAISNLFYFKDYFFNTWCTNNLEEKYLKHIREANRIVEPLYTNKLILKILLQHFPILYTLQDERSKSELTYILDTENKTFNISLGDVLACIDWLEKTSVDQKELMFLFAIKVFYTINLYENFKYKDEYQNRNEVNNNNLSNNEIGYYDILNGNFFNSEYLNIAPSEKGKSSRTKKEINCKLIKQIWEYENKPKKTSNDQEIFKLLQSVGNEETLKKMAEFFMLSTSYTIDASYNPSLYRRRNTVYYNYTINSNRNKACFDILSIFYNISDISKTYEKYNVKEELATCPLYKEIINQIKLTYNTNDDSKAQNLLTYITNIRQIEVIEQISLHLQLNRPKHSNILEIYKDIFDNLAKFSVNSHNINNSNGNNYSYSFFNVFKELMENIEKKDSLKKIFEKIMDEEKDTK